MAVKDALAEKTSRKNEAVKLTKNMSIADMIKAMEPEIKKALPQVITPELTAFFSVLVFPYLSAVHHPLPHCPDFPLCPFPSFLHDILQLPPPR